VPTLPSDPELARTHLVDVAETCFERYGIRRTTMEDIAAEAKVSRPTLYRYFGDRDSLVRAIAERRAARFAERMHTFFEPYLTLTERLVEGLLYLGKVGRRDEFFAGLISAEAVGEAHRVLMDGGDDTAAIDFARQVWEPVLLAAKENGELPDGVTFPGVYKWLTAANILLIGWYEIDGEATPEHREMLEAFLLPAFRKT
jgi:AcrR family transcriptional regulator